MNPANLGFLKPREIQMMRNDFTALLAASEACAVTVEYAIPVNPVYDPIYNKTDADSWTLHTVQMRALQQVVKPNREDLLQWGIVVAGDSIFYFDTKTEIKLDQGINGVATRFVIIDSGGARWMPIVKGAGSFNTWLKASIASSPYGQAVACTLSNI